MSTSTRHSKGPFSAFNSFTAVSAGVDQVCWAPRVPRYVERAGQGAPDEQLVEVVAVEAARHGLIARVQLRKVRLRANSHVH